MNMPELDLTCSNCRYWKVSSEIVKGVCHAEPPKGDLRQVGHQMQQIMIRPITTNSDIACRHFEPR